MPVLATFVTTHGTFTARLFDQEAPKTVENFVGLAEGTKEWTDFGCSAGGAGSLRLDFESNLLQLAPVDVLQSTEASASGQPIIHPQAFACWIVITNQDRVCAGDRCRVGIVGRLDFGEDDFILDSESAHL